MRLSHLSIVSGTCPGSVHHTIVEIPDNGPALFSPIPESPAELFLFFPALPGEYETWSVNYWNFE